MQRFEHETTTTCGYCGVGCRLETHARDGKIASISPALDGPANKGHTCVKGRFAHQYTRSRDRLTTPLIREGDTFRIASWEEAIGRIAREFTKIKSEHGPDAIAGPRLLARDQRGLLRDAAHDARRDRHQQHRQLLARLPLADVVRAAEVLRPLGRHRLVRRHRGLLRPRHHRRESDAGASGRRRAHEAGRARRHQADHDRPAPHRARRLRRPPPLPAPRHERRRDARDGACRAPRRPARPRLHRESHAGLRRLRRGAERVHAEATSRRSPASRPPTSSAPRTSTAKARPARSAGASA